MEEMIEFDQQDADAAQVREYVLHVDDENEIEPVMSDAQADWYIMQVREAENEYQRVATRIDDEIDALQRRKAQFDERRMRQVEYRKARLMEYMATVPARRTKTQAVYPLAYGTLRLKEMPPKFERDEMRLLEWAKTYAPETVKVKESPDWAAMKKHCEVRENRVYMDGLEVDGVIVEPQPPKLDIEFV